MRTRDRQKFARRIRNVADAIEAEPQQFEMHSVVDGGGFSQIPHSNLLDEWLDKDTLHCGTTACIGGWALAQNRRLISQDAMTHDWAIEAAAILGIPEATGYGGEDSIAHDLFYRLDMKADEAIEVLRAIADEFESGARG